MITEQSCEPQIVYNDYRAILGILNPRKYMMITESNILNPRDYMMITEQYSEPQRLYDDYRAILGILNPREYMMITEQYLDFQTFQG